MAHDDMHVVMYKILAYLYDCMKKGIEPRLSMIAHDGDMLSIPYPYWESIIRELVFRGYVRGVSFAKDGVYPTSPGITLEGVFWSSVNLTGNETDLRRYRHLLGFGAVSI